MSIINKLRAVGYTCYEIGDKIVYFKRSDVLVASDIMVINNDCKSNFRELLGSMKLPNSKEDYDISLIRVFRHKSGKIAFRVLYNGVFNCILYGNIVVDDSQVFNILDDGVLYTEITEFEYRGEPTIEYRVGLITDKNEEYNIGVGIKDMPLLTNVYRIDNLIFMFDNSIIINFKTKVYINLMSEIEKQTDIKINSILNVRCYNDFIVLHTHNKDDKYSMIWFYFNDNKFVVKYSKISELITDVEKSTDYIEEEATPEVIEDIVLDE